MKNISDLELRIVESSDAKQSLLKEDKKIKKAVDIIYKSLKKGGKILLCGNGGSAADAQHLAAEFLVRLRPKVNRSPIPAISLVMDTSTLTAMCNDISFDEIFSRNLEVIGNRNDILIAISTSGQSKNIIKVLQKSKKKKIFSIGFLGYSGGKAKKWCNLPIVVDSKTTARIQEAHIFLGHYIFEKVEDLILKNYKK